MREEDEALGDAGEREGGNGVHTRERVEGFGVAPRGQLRLILSMCLLPSKVQVFNLQIVQTMEIKRRLRKVKVVAL